MRNPNRLDDLYKRMCKVHKTTAPDQRIGQWLCNMLGDYYKDRKQDPFFIECKDFVEWMESYYVK